MINFFRIIDARDDFFDTKKPVKSITDTKSKVLPWRKNAVTDVNLGKPFNSLINVVNTLMVAKRWIKLAKSSKSKKLLKEIKVQTKEAEKPSALKSCKSVERQ